MGGIKVTQGEMKREPYVLTIAGILCLLNIPLVMFITFNNYSLWRIIGLVFISVVTQFSLAMYISKLLYFHHKKIVENMIKIEPPLIIKRMKIAYVIFYFGFYCVLLYLLTQRDTYVNNIGLFCFWYALYLPTWTRQGSLPICYIGDKNFIYGNIQVKIDDIERYEVKTLKKYKNKKREKIQLKIFHKIEKEIVVLDNSFSYILIEELEKILEKRYIDEKMKEYGLS